MKWNLDDLYLGFDDPNYQKDLNKVQDLINEYNLLPKLMDEKDELTVILEYIKLNQELIILVRTLSSFNSLTNATDVSNQESLVNMAKISNLLNQTTKTNVLFTRYLANVDLTKYIHNEIVKDNLFQLEKTKESANFLLSEQEEVLYSKLRQVASSSWGQIQSLLTAKLDVELDDKTITLSEVRNLAYENNQETRKKA